MTSQLTKSTSPSENGRLGFPMSDSTVAFLPGKFGKEKSTTGTWCSNPKLVLAIVTVIILLLALVIVLIILLTVNKTKGTVETNGQQSSSCTLSYEAKRIGLGSFLNELERRYYELMPEKIGFKTDVTTDEVRKHYRPYDPHPNAIKNFTDQVRKLYDRLEVIVGKANGSLLTMRENKGMYLAQFLLMNSFDWGPYQRDYYAGDWMFEPNLYCWQPICNILTNLEKVILRFQPKNLAEMEAIEELLKKHNDTISQYIENLKLGVATGMVRSVRSCKAGINALKRRYYDVAVSNASGILDEGVAISILADSFTAKITQDMNSTWYKRREESVRTSLKRFLLLYLGEPLHRLLRYLETEHLNYCYEEADGMAKLPLKSVYINGFPDRTRATSGKLPNGDVINATESYTKLLSFFTSGVISPEELRQMGNKKLNDLLKQAKKIARQYTGIQEDNTAVVKFKQALTSRDMFFNDGPFPVNESSEDAYMKCYDTLGALNHCPERWKALERWVNSTKEVAKLLKPKIKSLFYDTGPKKTTPKCGISVKGEYNPDVCFHGYEVNFGCVTSAYQTLPFFMNSHGPKYTQYTTVFHEQLPGHHLEVQGFSENFGDSCRDAISWISDENYLPSFTEGWATYVEYPLMVEDTDAYSNTQDKQVLLQKYGMVKYQILAALRSVLDTGMNYFGMTRRKAMMLYDEYAWDNSDLAIKDITRYQSSPGTVVSYMIGQETFARLRKQVEKELGSDFSLKEFHYQVLRQGELPLKYLEIHITRFIACKKDSSRPGCEEILS